MKKISSKSKRRERRDERSSTLAAAIPLIGFLLFGVLPLLLATIVAFTELHTTDLSEMKFVGVKNFITILTNQDDGRTYASYLSTIVFTLNVPICIGLSLYIANMVNRTKVGKSLFRAIFFIPYVCSTVVVAITFKILFANDGGVINTVLVKLGFEPRGWLTDSPMSFMMVAVVLSVWMGLGFCIVLFSASLANVDSSYYESARLDGATPFQMFWKITLPAISPTTAYLITMRLIGSLQTMTETYILIGGASKAPVWPGSAAYVSDTVVKHIYNMVFVASYKYGYGLAAAAGWILATIVFIITQINLKLQDRWVNYDF